MSEDFKIFLDDFYIFLMDIEAACSRLRTRIWQLTGVEEKHIINAPKPCSPDDPTIKWLQAKLIEVKRKHPTSQYTLLTSPDGAIMGLAVRCSDPDVLYDYNALAAWAFEKASAKPSEK
jgi:hypothetical protein